VKYGLLYAAATPPDVGGMAEQAAIILYACVGVAGVICVAVIAIRATRLYIGGERGYSDRDWEEQYAELQSRNRLTELTGDEDYANGHRETWDMSAEDIDARVREMNDNEEKHYR